MDRPDALSTTDSLLTIRDWLRFGVSTFNEANLVFGHGTDNALDEAAFLILSALHLPIDTLDPWLDCRLTQHERMRVRDLIAARISTRKPAAYLTQTAYIQGRKFYVDERVIVPRSFIGELICQNSLAAVVTDADAISSVLDLCTGSGCLAILAAEAFLNATVDASDISNDALAVARRNVGDYDLAGRVRLIQSDLFSAVPAKRYDLIISNPPYVTEKSIAKFAPEYQAEPRLAHCGGHDGLDLVHTILKRARDYLVPNGILVVEIGDGREALETSYPSLPFFWLDTETSEGEVFALTTHDLAAS